MSAKSGGRSRGFAAELRARLQVAGDEGVESCDHEWATGVEGEERSSGPSGASGRAGLQGDSSTPGQARSPRPSAAASDLDPDRSSLDEWLLVGLREAWSMLRGGGRVSSPAESIVWRAVFHLVRHAKGHQGLLMAPADLAWRELTRVLRDWPERLGLLDGDGRGVTSAVEDEDALREAFFACWPRVACPRGREMVPSAVRVARTMDLDFGGRLPGATRRLRLIAGMAAALQVARGELPIFLPRRKIAAEVGCVRATVTNCVRRLEEADLLRLVRAYPLEARRSTEYRFDLEAVPELARALPAAELLQAADLFERLPAWSPPAATGPAGRGRLWELLDKADPGVGPDADSK